MCIWRGVPNVTVPILPVHGVQAKTESKIDRSGNKVPSEVQSEIQRLRRQLQEKDVELEEVNADLKRLAADGTSSKVRRFLLSQQCMRAKKLFSS